MADATSPDYVVETAKEEGIPIVLAVPFELLRIAEGHPMILGGMGQERVCVKLASAEEFTELNRREAEKAGIEPASARQIALVTEPLVLPYGLSG